MNYYDYILNPICLKKKKKLDWKFLWIRKVDYIEKFYLLIKEKYNCIDDSINYYIVMAEMAIYYLKNYNNYYDYAYIQHEIILDDAFVNKFYEKEDVKERDFAEYLKNIYLNDNYDMENIYKLLNRGSSFFNYDLIVARLLFPNYYFFYLEKYLLDGDEKLFNIISRSLEYEEYVNNIIIKINEFKSKKIILPF